MLEMTLIRMTTLRPILPIDEILKKLEVLEKKQLSVGSAGQKEPSPPARRVGSKDYKTGSGTKEESLVLREEEREERVLEKKEPATGLAERKESAFVERRLIAEETQKSVESGEVPPRVREETWRGLVDFTRARNPILGSFLALGNLVHVSDEKIEIGFEKDSFHYERILEKENRSQLESICHEYLQKKPKVIISAVEQGMVSKGRGVRETEEEPRDESEKQMTSGGEENPLVEEALRLFNGRIVES
jgi:hypothetical protein